MPGRAPWIILLARTTARGWLCQTRSPVSREGEGALTSQTLTLPLLWFIHQIVTETSFALYGARQEQTDQVPALYSLHTGHLLGLTCCREGTVTNTNCVHMVLRAFTDLPAWISTTTPKHPCVTLLTHEETGGSVSVLSKTEWVSDHFLLYLYMAALCHCGHNWPSVCTVHRLWGRTELDTTEAT